MSISERIAALPKVPDIDDDEWPVGMQPDDWWTFWEKTSEAKTARLSLLSDAVSAYLNAVDEWEKEEPNLEPDDRKVLEQVRREDLGERESDLREVYRALA